MVAALQRGLLVVSVSAKKSILIIIIIISKGSLTWALLNIMRWLVYHLARLVGKVVWFQHA